MLSFLHLFALMSCSILSIFVLSFLLFQAQSPMSYKLLLTPIAWHHIRHREILSGREVSPRGYFSPPPPLQVPWPLPARSVLPLNSTEGPGGKTKQPTSLADILVLLLHHLVEWWVPGPLLTHIPFFKSPDPGLTLNSAEGPGGITKQPTLLATILV